MRVFIAESGAGSRIVAEELATVLPLTVPGVNTFLADVDLRKGVVWSTELLRSLDESDAGLFCVTAESLRNPWFNFEGGAIFNAVRNRQRLVYAYVISGSVPASSPFALFQLTHATEKETYNLFSQLNGAIEKGMQPEQVRRLFEKFWPDVRSAIASARRLSRTNGNGNGQP
jgi:hypothetical protein